MEYGKCLNSYDENNMRYVGWEQSAFPNPNLEYLFAPKTLDTISSKITELLHGVNAEGRSIIVPNDKIAHVMSQLLNNRPTNRQLGDVYTRYIIINPQQECPAESIINRSINIIVNYIRNEQGMITANKQLSIWDSVLGDFNRKGLRAHAPISAIRKKRPQTMMFNMNY